MTIPIGLEDLSVQMQKNIKDEITAMRDQLIAACGETDLKDDLGFPDLVIRTNVLKTEFGEPTKYPFFNSVFWTDEKGREIVKWSATENATPLIDVSRLEFFRSLDSGRPIFFSQREQAIPFRLAVASQSG